MCALASSGIYSLKLAGVSTNRLCMKSNVPMKPGITRCGQVMAGRVNQTVAMVWPRAYDASSTRCPMRSQNCLCPEPDLRSKTAYSEETTSRSGCSVLHGSSARRRPGAAKKCSRQTDARCGLVELFLRNPKHYAPSVSSQKRSCTFFAAVNTFRPSGVAGYSLHRDFLFSCLDDRNGAKAAQSFLSRRCTLPPRDATYAAGQSHGNRLPVQSRRLPLAQGGDRAIDFMR